MNIQHLHLHVRDRDVAEAFYRQWLGLAARRGECLTRDDTLASFRVRDPDGYAIEIYWEAPGAPLD